MKLMQGRVIEHKKNNVEVSLNCKRLETEEATEAIHSSSGKCKKQICMLHGWTRYFPTEVSKHAISKKSTNLLISIPVDHRRFLIAFSRFVTHSGFSLTAHLLQQKSVAETVPARSAGLHDDPRHTGLSPERMLPNRSVAVADPQVFRASVPSLFINCQHR